MESSWIDVPAAEVAVGDEVKVRGTGDIGHLTISYYNAEAERWRVVTQVDDMIVWFNLVHIDRLNITAVRRRKPEPQPKPGDWRCSEWDGFTRTYGPCHYTHNPKHESREVYRSGSGWSRDTRTGQPWVMQSGDPCELLIRSNIGQVYETLKAGIPGWRMSDESFPDYYKRIGLDVRPVDRRGKR